MTNRNTNHSAGVISRERFLSVLNDINYAALEIEQLDELLQLLADRLAEIINADGCYLTLWDEENHCAIPAAAYGPLRDEYKSIVPPPGEPTITAHVLELGKSEVFEDLWNSKFTSPTITRRFPAQTMLAIPIFHKTKRLGAALIAFNQHHNFSEQEIEYCEQAVRQISLAIVNLQNIVALQNSEENYRLAADALKASEAHLEEAQENAKMGSWELELSSRKLLWSSGLYRIFDIEPRESPPVRDGLLELIDEKDRAEFGRTLDHAADTLELSKLDVRTVNGRHLVGEMFYDESRDLLTGTMRDVTEERRLEAELLQARKMEAVGTLAGGIAHNFNNILTVIMGNYEILKNSTVAHSAERNVLDQCLDATERAAALTRQLLVVSRKQELKPSHLNVNNLITNLVGLLHPLLGDHIATTTKLASDLPLVYADQGHLEQVLLNLMLNARDAMGTGGKVNLTTSNTLVDGKPYVSIAVADDGQGIDPETLPHIFDPFFTTKDEGKGTGLGLATVASIIAQSDGRVTVDSEPGQGTVFNILLPALTSGFVQEQPMRQQTAQSTHSQQGRILLVEDNESLRNLAQFVLEKAEYQVTAVRDGRAALNTYRDQDFDLLLTDVQLPEGISGPQLAAELQEQRPELGVIFMSGLRDALPREHNGVFLPKPFRPHELLSTVQELLGDQGSPRVSE